MLLFALALAPGIAIMFFIYSKDNYDREPYYALVKSFLLGMLSTLPAIALQLAGSTVLKNFVEENSIIWFAILAFIIVGISEELCKFIMSKWYAYPKRYFNEPFDGIIYCVMVAMGFATLENIGYVYQHGIGTAFVRMFISVPAHGAFGVIMGYHLGLAKFMPQQKNAHFLKAILLPALLHGTFDFFFNASTK